jgi:hypothetical protein
MIRSGEMRRTLIAYKLATIWRPPDAFGWTLLRWGRSVGRWRGRRGGARMHGTLDGHLHVNVRIVAIITGLGVRAAIVVCTQGVEHRARVTSWRRN